MEVVCSKCVSECRSLGSTLVAAAYTLALLVAANWGLAVDASLMQRCFEHTMFSFTMPFVPFLLNVRAMVNVWVLKRKLLNKKGPPLDSMRNQAKLHIGGSTMAIMAYCPIFIQIPPNWEHIKGLGIPEKIWREEEVHGLVPLELPPRPPPLPSAAGSHNQPAAATSAQQQTPCNNSSCHYLNIPCNYTLFTAHTLGARKVLLELGLVPEYKQICFLRSRSTFQAIVTILQAVGYMVGVAARMVEHLGISPVEAILAFLCLLVTLQLLMELYACLNYQRPLLLRLDTDQFSLFHEKLKSSAQDHDHHQHQKTRFQLDYNFQLGACAMLLIFLLIAPLMHYALSSVRHHCHLCSLSIILFCLLPVVFMILALYLYCCEFCPQLETFGDGMLAAFLLMSMLVSASSMVLAIVATIREWSMFQTSTTSKMFAWILPHISSS